MKLIKTFSIVLILVLGSLQYSYAQYEKQVLLKNSEGKVVKRIGDLSDVKIWLKQEPSTLIKGRLSISQDLEARVSNYPNTIDLNNIGVISSKSTAVKTTGALISYAGYVLVGLGLPTFFITYYNGQTSSGFTPWTRVGLSLIGVGATFIGVGVPLMLFSKKYSTQDYQISII